MKVHRDGQVSRAEAEERARRQAEEELDRALTAQAELRSLVEDTQQRLAETEARFAAEIARSPRVRAVQRDAFIARAQQAARRAADRGGGPRASRRDAAAAGWLVQDAQATNLFAAEGVAVREVVTANGSAPTTCCTWTRARRGDRGQA